MKKLVIYGAVAAIQLYAHDDKSVFLQEIENTQGVQATQQLLTHANRAAAHAFNMEQEEAQVMTHKMEQLAASLTQEQKDQLIQLAEHYADQDVYTLEAVAAQTFIREMRKGNEEFAFTHYMIQLGGFAGAVWLTDLVENMDPQLLIHIMQKTLHRNSEHHEEDPGVDSQ